MLELKEITKDYATGNTVVHALRGISVTFRRSEFVAVLGASGCGKTTMLNIVGGLDRYTDGDLVINGKSTTQYNAYDWDTYRNKSVGFVFQSYNLIPHLSVLGNVELALTLTGETKAIRRAKAEVALTKVGLGDQINKRPNQLSGGQMQRVAIARAIVNDPEIILADEPTGALDSVTSVQIMDLLKAISSDRLVIMVTHNDALAKEYSTRIVRLLDGKMVNDSNPYEPNAVEIAETLKEEKLARGEYVEEHDTTRLTEDQQDSLTESELKAYDKMQYRREKARLRKNAKARRRTGMTFFTALSLSGRNLASKKARTMLVSFAGSIGIIGIALVLSLSNGFNLYINRMQSDTLAGFPIYIEKTAMKSDAMANMGGEKNDLDAFPKDDNLHLYTPDMSKMFHENKITQSYIDYVKLMEDKNWTNDIQYTYSAELNVVHKTSTGEIKAVHPSFDDDNNPNSPNLSVMQELLPNDEFIKSQYEVLLGSYPSDPLDAVLVLDKYNRILASVCGELGLTGDRDGELATEKLLPFDKIIGKEYKIITNNDAYTATPDGKKYEKSTNYKSMYESEDSKTMKIVGIMRIKESSPISLIKTGLCYLPSLTQSVIAANIASDLGKKQIADTENSYFRGVPYDALVTPVPDKDKKSAKEALHLADLQAFGITTLPSSVFIYPKNFEEKANINAYLNAYNEGKLEADTVLYTDASEILASTMGNMVDIISYVLIAFAAVSLVVSSIMIGIITYVSVIERTKEIGVLRSIGARKKDISRVFNAETFLIGFVAGLLGVCVSFVLTIPINAIINAVIAHNGITMNIGSLAVFSPLHALALVLISVVLTLISGLVPASIAAKKDPVIALRSE